MTSTQVEFRGSQGVNISASIDWPQGAVRAFALFAHCFTCSKDLFASKRVSQALTEHGFAVLRFDFTGLGRSEGEFADTNFSSNVGDLRAAADWLSQTHKAPSLLVGHSLGGAAVLAVAPDIASIRAVATIGAPASADHVLHLFAGDLDEIRANDEAVVDIGGRPFRVKSQFLEDASRINMAKAIVSSRAAKLILHAPLDAIVGIDNAEAIFLSAKHPKSFVSMDDADHLLTNKADAEYAADVIAAWASRFVPALPKPEKPEGHVLVSESGQGLYHLDINASGHHFNADEPVSVGGTDRGATPYDLLGAALGACTTITLRMYANRKKWPVSLIETEVSHDKCHAKDCASENATGKLDVFERRIRLVGELTDEQRERMLKIADMCPVHKTLESTAVVKSELIPIASRDPDYDP